MIHIKTSIQMKGFFRFQCINAKTGVCRVDTGFFPNQLLDSGRNIMATEDEWMDNCQVGTDNTAPNASQTGLLGHVAGTTTIQSDVSGASGSAPYYGWRRKVFRFAQGTVAANLTEAGVGWGTSGSTLISRALILDPVLQTPTTITPLADEFLDVTYELRYYAPVTDVTGPQVTLAGVVYDTITRAAKAQGAMWYSFIGQKIGVYNSFGEDWVSYDGTIGTVLLAPNGLVSTNNTTVESNGVYSNNSYALQLNCDVGSLAWNLVSGIRSMHINTTAGSYQTQFDANIGGASIPKSTDYTMAMKWTISWAEL